MMFLVGDLEEVAEVEMPGGSQMWAMPSGKIIHGIFLQKYPAKSFGQRAV